MKRASVLIDTELYNQIQQGLLLLVGVAPDDASRCRICSKKIANRRIFQMKKTNEFIRQRCEGRNSLFLNLPFTQIQKRNRPVFIGAAQPDFG